MLILLDGGEASENRRLSGQCLPDLLTAEISTYIQNRLYSAELPVSADFEGAFHASHGDALTGLLKSLQINQTAITRCRTAWLNVSDDLFDSQSSRDEFHSRAVETGCFRILATASSNVQAFGLAVIECLSKLMALPNYRKVLQAWSGPLKPSGMVTHHPEDTREEMAQPSGGGGRRTTSVSTHELFSNVQKQKEAIVDLLRRGEIAKVRTYASQLAASQLRNSDPEFAAMSLCDLAQQAKDVRQYSLQLELALMAAEIAPEDGWAHGQVADAYFCLGQYDNSLKAFHRAAIFGQAPFAAIGEARLLRASAKLPEAFQAYDAAAKAFPNENVAWTGRAEVLRDMQKLPEALEAYDLAVEKFPQESVPHCGRAAVLCEMGRLRDALEEYRHTLENLGDQSVPLCGMADTLKQLGRFGDAIEIYSKAAALFPNVPIPRCGKADVLREMGDLDQALTTYTEAVATFPYDPAPYSGRAETLKELGKYEAALEQYDEALEKFGDEARIRDGRANLLKKLGRFREALKSYDENIRRSPYDVVALSGRADALKQLGELEEAATAYGILAERYPTNLRVRLAKAAVLAAMRKYESAIELLPDGEPHTRDEWIGYHIRGMIHMRRNRLGEAANIFESGLARTPFANQRPSFENALAIVRLRQRNFDSAISFLAEAEEPIRNVLRMHAFGALNKLENAREAFVRLEKSCPPILMPLKNEVAAHYGISRMRAKHNSKWIFDEECRDLLLLAA